MTTTTTTKSPAEQLAEGLQNLIEPASRAKYPELWRDDCRFGNGQYEKFEADRPGRLFTRIIQTSGGSRHVHAFVDNATGAVLKAESWARPAKGVRYATVADALAKVAEDPAFAACGYYLYR